MNNKYIIGGILALILVVSAYFLFSKPSPKSAGPRGPDGQCLYGQDSNGNCLPMKEKCGQDYKPDSKCPNNQPFICDQNIGKWRCQLECESDTNPFPKDFKMCQRDNIKCDSKGKYYCDSDYCKNGGILYSNADGICQCDPTKFKGDRCECDISKCKGGDVDNSTSCKCISCCNKDTNEDDKGRCKYYGDDGNCSQECGDNQVYDTNSTQCVCKSGFTQDPDTKKCIAKDCGPNGTLNPQTGSCDCGNSGFMGDLCRTPICVNGKWNPSTKSCDCDEGQAGDRCQYTKENTCNNNGTPYINDSGSVSCNCNDGFNYSPHCACSDKQKPGLETLYKCQGLDYKCNEDKDPPYAGKWEKTYLTCEDIYKNYYDKANWQSQCTSLLNNKPYPQYKTLCNPYTTPSPDGQLNDFSKYQTTCSGIPTQEMLTYCTEGKDLDGITIPNNKKVPGGGCYISWNDKYSYDNSTKTSNTNLTTYGSYCACKSLEGSDSDPSYYCQLAEDTQCGPLPPKGYCSDGRDPLCVTYTDVNGVNAVYACQGSKIPESVAISLAKLQSHKTNKDSDNLWWAFTQDSDSNNVLPLFPTVNMDICDKNNSAINLSDPTDNGQVQLQNFQPASESVTSQLGFVTGTNKDPTFYDYNDPSIMIYNVTNAKLSDDKNTISFI